MTIKKKFILYITSDERFALDRAQEVLADICKIIEDKEERNELSELYHVAEEVYRAIGTIYDYAEEDYT